MSLEESLMQALQRLRDELTARIDALSARVSELEAIVPGLDVPAEDDPRHIGGTDQVATDSQGFAYSTELSAGPVLVSWAFQQMPATDVPKENPGGATDDPATDGGADALS